MNVRPARARNIAAMIAIGDGVLTLLNPKGHSLLWQADVPGYGRAVDWFVKHPTVTRVSAALAVGIGIWLAYGDQRRAECRG